MTRKEAFRLAQRRADRTKSSRYVVYESGEYDAVNDEDLELMYAGCSQVWEVEPR